MNIILAILPSLAQLGGSLIGATLAVLIEKLSYGNLLPPGRLFYVRIIVWSLGFSTLFMMMCEYLYGPHHQFVASILTTLSTLIVVNIGDRRRARSKGNAS